MLTVLILSMAGTYAASLVLDALITTSDTSEELPENETFTPSSGSLIEDLIDPTLEDTSTPVDPYADFDVVGTELDDHLVSEHNNGTQIAGLAGDDLIEGQFDVFVEAGEGNDTIIGDTFFDAHGDQGDDVITTAGFSDLYGGEGNDSLESGYNSNLYGGDGDDTLAVTDTSGFFISVLEGNDGSDLIYGGPNSRLDGGDGDDTINLAMDILANDWASDFEEATITGGQGSDQINLGFDLQDAYSSDAPLQVATVTDFDPSEDVILLTSEFFDESGSEIVGFEIEFDPASDSSAILVEVTLPFSSETSFVHVLLPDASGLTAEHIRIDASLTV